ncbi:MAG: DUF2059 domain-containing protein [Rariglobus sp.]
MATISRRDRFHVARIGKILLLSRMNTLWLAVLWFGLTVGVMAADVPLPELRGVLATGTERRFALSEPGGASTAWVTVGQQFAGWKLKAYRAADDVLVLTRDGRDFDLKLSSSTVGQVDATKATVADAEALLSKMKFDEMLGKILEQQKQTMVSMTQKMTGSMKGVDTKDFAAFQSKMMDTMFSELNPEAMRGDMAKVYSEIFTKSELAGLSDFYGTEAGRAMIDKQPALTQKMNELMIPRIMAAMPKVQKLSMEFGQEQAAKKKAAAAAAAAAQAEAAPAATP